jgi:hypothetical protein
VCRRGLRHGWRNDHFPTSADVRLDPQPIDAEHDGQLLDDRILKLAARQRTAQIRDEHEDTLLPGDVAIVF